MTDERNYDLTVADVMSKHPDVVAPDTLLRTVAEKMRDHDVGALPVVDDGQLLGIITDRDIVVQAVALGVNPNDSVVGPYVSTELVKATVDMTLDQAADLMARYQVRRLPVVDGVKVVGIVSMQDLAQSGGASIAGQTETAITETAEAGE